MISTINRKIASLALTASLAAVGLTSTANAQLISLNFGNFTINANGYSASSLSANLNDSAPGGLPASGGGIEDSYGIFQITSILDGGITEYTSNLGTEYWGVFYNSVDQSVSPTGGGNLEFTSTGLKLDIYKVNVLDAGDALFQAVYLQGLGGRIDIDEYNGITNAGALVLSSEIDSNGMLSFFSPLANSTFATGNLNVTFNNMFEFGSEFLGIDTMQFGLSGLTRNVPADWSVKFDGPIDGELQPVPEPSTYGLMAAGLLVGVVAIRRRMQKKAQS